MHHIVRIVLAISLVAFAAVSNGMAWATDPGILWGVLPRSGAGSPSATGSTDRHYIDSLTAISLRGGEDTLLPGATINAIGVFNEISVVGDNNMIDALQQGDNSGDVSSAVNIGQ